MGFETGSSLLSAMSLPKPGPVFRIFLIFFASAVLGAGESWDLKLADLYYSRDDYTRAYELYEYSVLQGKGLSGDMLYRYGYCYEQTRGLDGTALKIYALSLYYNRKEGRAGAVYGLYADAKLKGDPAWDLDDGAAAAILGELRDQIDQERRAVFYRWVDRWYPFFTRFSVFQWKIIASLIMLIPFFAGILILGFSRRKNRL
jgi:hypothetical protein